MLLNYLKITLRNLWKNRLFVIINVLGLGMALACCIVAFLNWDYNSKFDHYHANTEDVYRVNFIRITNGRPIKNGSCPMPLGDQIRNSIAEVEKVIRYFPMGGDFKVDNEVFRAGLTGVDPEFFEVFNFPMLTGNAASLQDRTAILISEELKDKYFPGQADPTGESLTYISGDKRIEYQVGGVFTKPPMNTSFSAQAYTHYENTLSLVELEPDDWQYFNCTFVTIPNATDVTAVEKQLEPFIEIQNRAKEDYKVAEYYLDPFVGMAVRAEREDIWNHWFDNSLPVAAAFAPGIMAFLILLIACFNFTNTSIAIANRRIKEIGIRKVLGSNKKQLIAQFLGENVLLTFLALLAGLIMATFLVPAYSAMWPFLEIRLNLLENIDLVGFLFALLLFTALLAGSYPAFYISSFQPTSILRGTVKFAGTNLLTRVLLTLQYSISLLAIISGFVFSQNAVYQENYDMGFETELVVSARIPDEQGYTRLRNELQGYDKVIEMAGSEHSITNSWYTDPIKYESEELDVSILNVGTDYLSAIGATVLQGRDFIENSQTDVERSVIINQQLARTMGWNEAIGKRILLRDTIALNVVGVVKDIYFQGGLWEPLQPMLMRYVPEDNYRFLTVRAAAEDILSVKALMDEKWRNVFPDQLSTVSFMEEEKAEAALVNYNIKVMFVFLGVLAVVLSAIGMFSLVSLNLIKRMKEIGVRKVLGASIENITMKVSREFIIILLVASVLGVVASYYLTDLLMGSIWTYYVPPRLLPYVLSVLILFAVSWLTIGGKVLKAASVNPAQILRDE